MIHRRRASFSSPITAAAPGAVYDTQRYIVSLRAAPPQLHFLRRLKEQLSLPLPDLSRSGGLEKQRLCRKLY